MNPPKKENTTYRPDLFKETNTRQINPNQGIYNGDFYYGKQIMVLGQPTNCLIFEDGRTLVDFSKIVLEIRDENGKKHKETYGINEIKENGITLTENLTNFAKDWSNHSITDFIQANSYLEVLELAKAKETLFEQQKSSVVSVVRCNEEKNNYTEIKHDLSVIIAKRSIQCSLCSQNCGNTMYVGGEGGVIPSNNCVVSDTCSSLKLLIDNNPIIINLINNIIYKNDDISSHVLFSNYNTLTTQAKDANLELINRIKLVFQKYMDVPDQNTITLATYYTLATYCYTIFESIGYLFFNSDRETGKTRFASLICDCAYHPINATNISEAALFRAIESLNPTLLIDDFEGLDNDRKNALTQILKVGYKDKGATIRMKKEGENYVLANFNVYCPKIITNTTSVDEITLTRCIPIHLERTTSNKGKLRIDENNKVFQKIRDDCHLFMLFNWRAIKKEYDEYVSDKLNNRDLEISRGILAIAKFIDPVDHDALLDYLVKCFVDREMIDSAESWDYLLFCGIWERVGKKEEWFKTKDLYSWFKQDLLAVVGDDEVERRKVKVPDVRFVGRKMAKIASFKRRRIGAGVEYLLSKEIVERYMVARGYYVPAGQQDLKGSSIEQN